jgi:beta-glucosidase
VEWSRVETAEGQFDRTATEHYVDYFRSIAEAEIKPWVTLFHFTNPIWFADKGEWHKRENVACFLRFVEHIVPKIAPYVDLWLPINEYNFYTGAPVQPAEHQKMANYAFNVLRADAGAHDIFDRTMTDYADWCANGWYYHAMRTGELVFPFTKAEYLPEIKGRADFWGVNMYARDLVSARHANCRAPRHHHRSLIINKAHETNPWEITPDELMENLHRLKDKPVYITENGCNTDNDEFRITYIALHLAAFRQAIDDGVDIRCYLYWSLLDNFEWGSYDPKFGMVAFDRETFERRPKSSSAFFKDVIEQNGISGQLVQKYLSHLPTMRQAGKP